MATVRQRKRVKGVVYQAEICVAGRRESATFDTKSAAYAWAEKTEHLLRTGQPLPGELPNNDRALGQAIAAYLDHLERTLRNESTKHMYRHCAKRLAAAFAGKTLLTLAKKHVADYRDQRLQVVGPSSIRHDFVFLRGLYRHARLQWDLDTTCPAQDIREPAPAKNREPLLTLAEIERLLDWCCVSSQERLYSYVLLLLHTAMRPSEAASLTWQQWRPTERVLALHETKTGQSRRVPLTAAATRALEQLHRLSPESERIFLPREASKKRLASGFFRRSFETACRNAGLTGITLYSLRHIAASYLIMNGVDIRTVAEIMGHRNISQTMRYTHLLDAHKLRAIAALDKLGQ